MQRLVGAKLVHHVHQTADMGLLIREFDV
jgi:hypothetical protein